MTLKELLTLCPYLRILKQQVKKGEGSFGQRLEDAKLVLKGLVGWDAGLPYEHPLNDTQVFSLAYCYLQGVVNEQT